MKFHIGQHVKHKIYTKPIWKICRILPHSQMYAVVINIADYTVTILKANVLRDLTPKEKISLL